MDYGEFLEHSYTTTIDVHADREASRLEYLADYIFDFTTYDGSMSELFAAKAVEVCAAINDSKTFEYIKEFENYKWYLLMCNMPFFAGKLNWGTSIRGAWWDYKIEFRSLGLWKGDQQITEPMEFNQDEWKRFVAAIIKFASQSQK